MGSATRTPEKDMFGFRAESPLAERIRDFSDRKDMSESDAIRALIRHGLRAEELEQRVDELEQRIDRMDSRRSREPWLQRLFR